MLVNKLGKKKRISLILLALLGWAGIRSALAHGGGTLQVGRAPAGPYLVSVWTNPAAPKAGETLHVTVGVIQPGDGTAVLDANVQVQVMLSGRTLLVTEATTEKALNKLFYETDFPLTEMGAYDFTVQVDGADGSGQTSFSLEIKPAGGFGPVLGGLVSILIVAIVGGTAVLLIRHKKEKVTAI